MGMPCQVNSILKLGQTEFPAPLQVGDRHSVCKAGYRILPLDVPLQLVNAEWQALADVVVHRLTWTNQVTHLEFEVQRVYPEAFGVKSGEIECRR